MDENHKLENALTGIGAEPVPEDIHELAEAVVAEFRWALAAPQGDDSTISPRPIQPPVRLVPDVPTELADGVSREARPIVEPSNRRHGRRFVVMFQSRKVRWCAAVGASAAAVVLIVTALTARPSITLADVQSAVAGQTWVHLRYDDGREEWTDLHNGCRYVSEAGVNRQGMTTLLDPAAGIRMDYWPTRGRYIEKRRIGREATPITPWEMVVGPAIARDKRLSPVLHREVVGGRQLVRLDRYLVDAFGGRSVAEQIWADPVTRLPVRTRYALGAAERREQNREWVTGEYEFPVTGPSSLEDLGVPANLPVVDLTRPTPQDAQQVIDAGAAARDRFPMRYRAIRRESNPVLQEANPNDIWFFWRDGDRYRLDQYWNIPFPDKGKNAKYHLDLPATDEQILTWAASQGDARYISVFADGKTYFRDNPHPAFSNDAEPSRVQVHKFNGDARNAILRESGQWPHNRPWPYVRTSGPWQILPQSKDLSPGCIGLRREAGIERYDYIIDPGHDYICVNCICWKQKDGQWIEDHEEQSLDLRQLPAGQWYPATQKRVWWPSNDASKRHEQTYENPILLLEESDLPADLFNEERLFQRAEVEAG